jgi:hypothetical protein
MASAAEEGDRGSVETGNSSAHSLVGEDKVVLWCYLWLVVEDDEERGLSWLVCGHCC